MTTAQAILDRLTPLPTPQLEEILELLDARGDLDDAERTVRLMTVEALEIRDPSHPAVAAALATYQAEWDALG